MFNSWLWVVVSERAFLGAVVKQALSTVGPGKKQRAKHKLDMGLICDSPFAHGLYCHVKYRILYHEHAR